jgi:hypothetical protein
MQEEEEKTNSGKKKKRNKKAKPTLTPPFRWRCRVCSEEGEAEELERHCGKNVRQLAPVSEEGTEWFNVFLGKNTWKFIPPDLLSVKPQSLMDEEKVALACKAGNELEAFLQGVTITVPSHYELYNANSDHLRISDLKKKLKLKAKGRSFTAALNSALKWEGKVIPLVKTCPKGGGPIELGHVFDEYFTMAFQEISSGLWAPGKRVNFSCEELELIVSGTPDLFYDGIPVEMKTTAKIPISSSKMGKSAKTNFRNKWKTNYLPQIAMYSHACGLEWMFLLLISKQTGEFSIVPVNGKEKLNNLRKRWATWMNDGRIKDKLEEYRKLEEVEEE